MTVLAILGSRNPNGQTAQAAGALREGVIGEGGQYEQVFLPQMKIERCRQCEDDGWGLCRKEGRCVIEDNFSLLVDKLKKANRVVFATPVYFSDLSESMHAFLDRLWRTCMHESGKEKLSGKPAMGICVAGGGGGGAPACTVSLEKYLSGCGFDVVDMMPVRRQNLAMKLSILKATGKWLVKGISSV